MGSSKSQIAIELYYQFKEKFKDTWVFWIHGSNAVRFKEGYEAIARKAKIDIQADQGDDVLQTVCNWLQDTSQRWFMVLDNADTESVFFHPSENSSTYETIDEKKQKLLAEYIPRTHNGTVLITARDHHVGVRFTNRGQDVYRIGTMNEQPALDLLKLKMGYHFEQHEGKALANALECMPLALTQASAFICQMAPDVSTKDYLAALQRENDGARYLRYKNPDARRDAQARNSVYQTWRLSFDHIRVARPTAAQLLSLMSFFDRQGIPRFALLPPWVHIDDNGSEFPVTKEEVLRVLGQKLNIDEQHEAGFIFTDDVKRLTDFCLVRKANEKGIYDMHSLVQSATRDWLKGDGQLDRWKHEFIFRMFRFFQSGEPQSTYQKALLPHTSVMATQEPHDVEMAAVWALSLMYAGCYASARILFGLVKTFTPSSLLLKPWAQL